MSMFQSASCRTGICVWVFGEIEAKFRVNNGKSLLRSKTFFRYTFIVFVVLPVLCAVAFMPNVQEFADVRWQSFRTGKLFLAYGLVRVGGRQR